MKIFICIFSSSISSVRNFNIEVSDNYLIDSLSSLINSEQNISNCEYEFVYKKQICQSDKTLKELDIIENSKIYAIKKNLKTLKRQSNDNLQTLLNFGSSKKLCTISNQNYLDHISWKNNGLNEIQAQMTKMITENPSLIESFIHQPDVESLVNNPLNISTLYSANRNINDTMNNHPDKVKFFTDVSQYVWIKNIMEDPKKYDHVMENYSENLKQAMNSKRYRRMIELFDSTADKTATNQESTAATAATAAADEEEVSQKELETYSSSAMQPILNSPYANHIIDIIGTDNQLSDSIFKHCPYGSNLDETSLAAIRNVMPSVIGQWKKAITHSNDPEKVMEYLHKNPIELDEDEAQMLEQVTEKHEMHKELDETPITHDDDDDDEQPIISQLVQEITNRFECGKESDKGTDGIKSFDKELEVLNEMGFTDNIVNLEAVTKERGILDRTIYRLLA